MKKDLAGQAEEIKSLSTKINDLLNEGVQKAERISNLGEAIDRFDAEIMELRRVNETVQHEYNELKSKGYFDSKTIVMLNNNRTLFISRTRRLRPAQTSGKEFHQCLGSLQWLRTRNVRPIAS